MSEQEEAQPDAKRPGQPWQPGQYQPPPPPDYPPPPPPGYDRPPEAPQYPPPPPPGYVPPPSSTPPPVYAPPGQPPAPPGYPPAPPQDPQSRPPLQRQARGGFLGGLISVLLAIWAFLKYGGVFLLKFGAFKTLITLVISFGAYAVFFGPAFALGLVVMILVHEMGHVVEIRRQGMQASAPLFIPFFGAAIF